MKWESCSLGFCTLIFLDFTITPSILKVKQDTHETLQSPVSNVGDQYANIALNTTGLFVEHVVCHPFVVLRRQCQVGGGEGITFRTHLTPFSLLPVVIHIYQWQGLSAFYKGLSSSLTVRGLQLAAEDATTKFTPWPKVKSFCSHYSDAINNKLTQLLLLLRIF